MRPYRFFVVFYVIFLYTGNYVLFLFGKCMPKHKVIYNHKIKDKGNKTESQLAKFKRQKCINLMEKLLKNLFRMFRDDSV